MNYWRPSQTTLLSHFHQKRKEKNFAFPLNNPRNKKMLSYLGFDFMNNFIYLYNYLDL